MSLFLVRELSIDPGLWYTPVSSFIHSIPPTHLSSGFGIWCEVTELAWPLHSCLFQASHQNSWPILKACWKMQGGLGQDIFWMFKVFSFTFWPFYVVLYLYLPVRIFYSWESFQVYKKISLALAGDQIKLRLVGDDRWYTHTHAHMHAERCWIVGVESL